MKNKALLQLLIIIFTIFLASSGVFIALKMFESKRQTIAPTAPESEPEAAGSTIITKCQRIKVPVAPSSSASPSPSASPAESPSPSYPPLE